ncbi:MAG: hypothetical protein WAN79_13080 [Opitutaceae bacterium]
MKYHIKAVDSEWEIEPSNDKAWVLKKRAGNDCLAIGTYKSPNEAAVMAGARMTSSVRFGRRHFERLKFVLSSWEVVEQC